MGIEDNLRFHLFIIWRTNNFDNCHGPAEPTGLKTLAFPPTPPYNRQGKRLRQNHVVGLEAESDSESD